MGVPTVDVFDLPAFAPEHRGGPRECADKLASEAAELFAEVRTYDLRCDCKFDTVIINIRNDIALELADVLQVCRNICEVCGITPDMVAEAMAACVEKNQTKDGGRY